MHEAVRAAEVAAGEIAEIDGRDIQAAGRRQRQPRREPPGVGKVEAPVGAVDGDADGRIVAGLVDHHAWTDEAPVA